jgi:DNA-binding transcriptional MerR regulator
VIGVAPEVERVRIGELARATGTTARALRHYEQAGLISSERAPNGYRVYDERSAVRVRNIRYLLAAGLTVDDVRVFLPCLDGDVATAPASNAGLRVALERLAVLNERIAAQTDARDRLEAALREVAGPYPVPPVNAERTTTPSPGYSPPR